MDSQKMMIALLLFLSSSVILFSQTKSKGEILMQDKMSKYGIEGYQAPELNVPLWIDGEGKEITPVKLEDYKGKFKVIYCFQAWCPGCHSRGLPALQKMVEALKDKEQVAFFAI
ncbi:MAG: redoxin domain-containing protein, partial [Saprospiraceae bacterium]|nr:redoxin domain-containing protein [Saprospiraceae bacterium]